MALPFQIQSGIILFLIYLALYFRKERKKHVPIILTAIIWDVILILQIELTRGAVEKAVKFTTNKAILNFHVSIAVSVVILYVVLIILGRKLLKGNMAVKPLHRILGCVTVILRTTTLVTSYLIVE